MIKAKEEIAGIARSAQIAEQALLASLKDFRPGDTEQDLGNSFRRHAAQHGAKDIFCVATANKRAAFCDMMARSPRQSKSALPFHTGKRALSSFI